MRPMACCFWVYESLRGCWGSSDARPVRCSASLTTEIADTVKTLTEVCRCTGGEPYTRGDCWLMVDYINITSVDKKNQLDITFVFFISLLLVAQHIWGNHVPIISSWRLRDFIASCWYVPWLQEGCQDRLTGSASMDGFVAHWITMHGQPYIRFISVTIYEPSHCVRAGIRSQTQNLIRTHY